VYNGEIFNYYELLEKFKNDFTPKTTCDTELLAWGLDTHNISFIDLLDSMHGFAYYDRQNKKLILSRDHAGIKPVYYAETHEGLVFGSEIKGMLDRVPNSRKIDEMALSCYSATGINVTRHSFFNNIKKLMCGETVTYHIEQKKLEQVKRILTIPNANQKINYKEFREKVQKTVKMCSIGKREIGVFLSGGIDSTMIAYELNKIKPRARTFTNKMEPHMDVGNEDYNSDHKCALKLAKQYNFNHTIVKITPEIYIDNWDTSIYMMEEPTYNPSLSMYSYTNKVLSDKGIVVTMAGDMGDEILGGYPAYWKVRKQVQLYKKSLNSWEKIIDKYLNRLKRPPALPDMRYSQREIIEELINTTFPKSIYNASDPVTSYMMLDVTGLCPEDYFRRNDKFGMAVGMEGRFPLATKMFMQYCMNIRSQYKIGFAKNDTKLLSKKAYRGKLPNSIIFKTKTGWTVPAREWANHNVDKSLITNAYRKSQGKGGLSKDSVPAWMLKDWMKKYQLVKE
jgi:asparagine synthase (glutamine-hydrolysing)